MPCYEFRRWWQSCYNAYIIRGAAAASYHYNISDLKLAFIWLSTFKGIILFLRHITTPLVPSLLQQTFLIPLLLHR